LHLNPPAGGAQQGAKQAGTGKEIGVEYLDLFRSTGNGHPERTPDQGAVVVGATTDDHHLVALLFRAGSDSSPENSGIGRPSFLLPAVEKQLLQISGGWAVDAYPQVPPSLRAFSVAGIFVTDIETRDEGGLPVDDCHLAMIALVEPGNPLFKGRRIKGETLDTLLLETPEKRAGRLETTDIIVQEEYLHSPFGSDEERLGESAAGTVIPDYVKLQDNVVLGLLNGMEHGREEFSPLPEELDSVPTGDDCLGIPPEKPEEAR